VIRIAVLALGLALAAGGAWQWGSAATIHAKAALAQHLIRASWQDALAGGPVPPPWPWADTRPVARLMVPRLGVDQVVLAGASGRTLAFGPGHMDGTPLPGKPGNSVLSGHRDTHFRFLRHLRAGDRIAVGTADGAIRRFRVSGTAVLDTRTQRLGAAGPEPTLSLVTCYPFDAVAPGGPLRYLVSAVAVPAPGLASEAPPAL
jgi:sortase A